MSEGASVLAAAPTGEPTGEAPTGETAAPTGETAQPESWSSGFDEATQAYVKNKGWDSPDKVLESYRNLERFQGGAKNVLEIPGEDADETALSDFYNKLGRPDTPDQYGIEGDEEFSKAAYELGLSKNQAASLYEKLSEKSASDLKAYEEQVDQENAAALDTLKQQWGRDYDKNVLAGQKAAHALGYGEEALLELETGMGTQAMMELFSKVGSMMSEPDFITGQAGDFSQSEHSARQELEALKMDSKWMDEYLAGDPAKHAKWTALNKKAFPG